MDGIEIKQASLEDADMILQLQIQAYLTEAEIYNDYGIPPLIQSFNEIKQEFSQQIFLKAIEKGEEEEEEGGDQTMTIVGSVRAYLERGTAYIGRLIVKPEYQNKGIGTKLMEAIEQHFRFGNRYELFTGHKSTQNLHLYQKLGYYEFKRVLVTISVLKVGSC